MDPAQDLGIPGGSALLAFADAVIGPDRHGLDKARAALEQSLGPAAVSAAAIIAATFTKNDRIANGVGLPAEPRMMSGGDDIREMLQLKSFKSAWNTYRHSPKG